MSNNDGLFNRDSESTDKDDKNVELLENPNFGKKGSLLDSDPVINDVKRFNQSINFNQNLIHNEIAKNLNVENEENENNDAVPEKLFQTPDDINKTLDDIFTMQMFGKKDPNEKEIEFNSRTAGMLERMLHPMQYGSLRGSIFALSSMCLEAGSLVLATRCKQFGLVNFLLALCLGAGIAYWTLVMMIKAARNIKERDYSKVVKLTLGKKVGVFMDINIALYLFGAIITFQVIIFKLIGSVAYDIYKIFADSPSYEHFEDFLKDFWDQKILKFPIMFGVILLVIPLCLLKDISKMRFASLIGVLALIYSILVIVIESPFIFYKKYKDRVSEMNWFDIRKAFSSETNYAFFSGMATVFYIFACHAGAFPVYKTLKNNTSRRIRKVFRRSILLDLSIYFFVAIASYLTEPFEKIDLIVYRELPDDFLKTDYFMIVAKVGIVFDLFFSTPANYAALRISVFELIWGNTNITDLKNIIVTFSLLLIITLIGAVYSDILSYISLLGGFCSVIYCILIPGLIYVKNNKDAIKSFTNILVISIVVGLTIIGYISGVFTILFDIVGIN